MKYDVIETLRLEWISLQCARVHRATAFNYGY